MKFLVACFLLSQMMAMGIEYPPDSHFELDSNLVNSIYEESLYDEGMSEISRNEDFSVNAEFGYVTPTDLSLSNQYFDVHYSEDSSSMPSFRVGIGKGIAKSSLVSLRAVAAAGYGRKQTLMTVTSKLGGDFRDLIQLNWVPLSAGLRGEISPFASGFIRPFLETEAGVSWLYQTGKLDKALEQGFWIPFFRLSGGLVLFGSSSPTSVFGGITLGASLMRGLGSQQKMDAWSMNAGVSLYL